MPIAPLPEEPPPGLPRPAHEILIVGGGFSGVALACALLRMALRPLRVRLVERSPRLGRGLAYGTIDSAHLLNVPAGRMGLQAADEGGFARYLAERGLPWMAPDFVPRALYGEYLADQLALAVQSAAPGVLFEAVNAEVAACNDAGVVLADGRSLHAEALVLATGGWAADWPAALQDVAKAGAAGWVADPWQPGALDGIAAEDELVLLGSGLSALDMLLSLQGRGHRGRLWLLSRRGLLPQPHRGLGSTPAARPAMLQPATRHLLGLHSTPALLRTLRAWLAQGRAEGDDWRELLTGLRDATPALWQGLPQNERARFLRHLQPFWDTHRHRAAPPVRAAADAALRSGRLQLLAGRVLFCQARPGGGCTLQVRQRADGHIRTVQADGVINCTGAGPAPALAVDAASGAASGAPGDGQDLWQSLMGQGLVQVDAHRLGIEVDDAYRLRQADGTAHPHWHYIGPLLRAQHWEATAVPELRRHAEALAGCLLDRHCA